MTDRGSDLYECGEEQADKSFMDLPESAYFSYYRDDNKDTGGMQVKWTIRVAGGAEAGRLDDRQNHAIRELLQWAHQRQHRRP